ncbi:MAG: hypothetical protein ACREV0_03710 [Burkholderiales bacterium]
MSDNWDHIDWSLTTWEGSRREQLRRHCRLSLREKLLALDELQELANHFREQRSRRGLPVVESDQG